MNVWWLLPVVGWLSLSAVVACVARASKMSFVGWLLAGFLFPVILLALLAEYGVARLFRFRLSPQQLLESQL